MYIYKNNKKEYVTIRRKGLNMQKSYYCEKLEHSLNILPDRISFCCSCAEGCHFNIDNFDKLDFNEIFNKRNEYIEQMKHGVIPHECSGCCEYKEYPQKTLFQKIIEKLFKNEKSSNKGKINYIVINHFKQCECNCVYCAQKILYPTYKQNFNSLPIIQELFNKNLVVGENLHVEFQGGNVSLLNEFDSLIDELKKHNTKQYSILTNGIKWLPAIEKIKDNTNSLISCSLDCGTPETFKKIKNIDGFNSVIENLKRIKNSTELTISLKYIILEGINDNIEELNAFLNIAKEINSCVTIEIDYRKLFMNSPEKYKIPQKYYDMYNYAERFCNENDLIYRVSNYMQQVLDRGYNF